MTQLFGSTTTHNDPRATELRTCGTCKADAVTCVHVTLHSVNGIPAGRTYVHRCQQCRRTFTTMSVWRTVRDLFAITLFGMLGLFLVPFATYAIYEVGITQASGSQWGFLAIAWFSALFAMGLIWTVVSRTYRLFENPVARR